MAKGGSGKVISMAEKMYIKQLYEDGVSKSEIQRRTKVNYRTVCKYADMEDWNDDKLPNMNRITIRCSVSISPSSMNGWKVMPQPQESSGIPPRGYMTGFVRKPVTRADTAA